MKLAELDGTQVIARESGDTVATARSVIIDPETARVRALVLADERVVDWSRVVAVGPDATIVDSGSALRAPADEDEARAVEVAGALLGKRVLTTSGDAVGGLDDVVVDEDGRVTQMRVGQQSHDGAALVAIGPFAVLVRPER